MKTQEELNALKEEVETLNKKLAELTEEEFTQVRGGNRVSDTVCMGGCEGDPATIERCKSRGIICGDGYY